MNAKAKRTVDLNRGQKKPQKVRSQPDDNPLFIGSYVLPKRSVYHKKER